MLGTTPEDLAQFLHQEERLDSVTDSAHVSIGFLDAARSRSVVGAALIISPRIISYFLFILAKKTSFM